jgi:4-diphosphocytidyl-2-C-methyl-D-erythritol kinase
VPDLADRRPIRVRVPAKINLYLGVGPRRPDGFHELHTVFQALDLFDDVVVRHAGAGIRLTVTGAHAEAVPTDATNLAWRAAQLVADRAGQAAAVSIELIKNIPVAGGMAGGSADAAGALLACSELWHTGGDRSELPGLAAQLGSDVAFGVLGGTALGTGRGEILAPVPSTGTFWWVFALADFGLSTPAVYAEFDRLSEEQQGVPSGGDIDAVLDAVRTGDVYALASALSNDLQPAALSLAPSLERTLTAGRNLGALAGLVCGSGPTCAFLVTDQPAAKYLAETLASKGVCRTTRVASGPAPGARVVH